MKIKELVEKYNKNQRIDLSKELEVVPYVSIALKRRMAQLILDNCVTIVDGEVHIDSVERYILFTIASIAMHTNLEFVYDEDGEYGATDDYDILCESGLLIKIIDTFKDDYAACQEILNMMTTDLMQNNITLEKKIYQFLDSIQDILSGAVDNLTEKVDLDFLKDGSIDKEQLSQLLSLVANKE